MQKEEKNIFRIDPTGRPIPNPCHICFEPSIYGRDNKWYCLQHWIESDLWKNQK